MICRHLFLSLPSTWGYQRLFIGKDRSMSQCMCCLFSLWLHIFTILSCKSSLRYGLVHNNTILLVLITDVSQIHSRIRGKWVHWLWKLASGRSWLRGPSYYPRYPLQDHETTLWFNISQSTSSPKENLWCLVWPFLPVLPYNGIHMHMRTNQFVFLFKAYLKRCCKIHT